MFDLTGRKAVVTGASRGIGQATAIALARAGMDVASISLPDPEHAPETVSEIEGAGRRALFVEGDVGDPEKVRAFGAMVEAEFGGIDLWVNNASRLMVRPFLDMDDDDWREILASNLLGYVHGCRAALNAMLPRGRGSIVNISSITDIQPIADMAGYITAKGGVVALTKTLAVEYGSRGIVINAVAPGAVETPLTAGIYTPEVRRLYESRIAQGRVARPLDIAGAVLFLATDAASYMCGHELVVDGGMTLNGSVGFATDAPPAGSA